MNLSKHLPKLSGNSRQVILELASYSGLMSTRKPAVSCNICFLSAFLGSSSLKPSRTPWQLRCLNPEWSVRVPKLEASLMGGTEMLAEAGNPPPKVSWSIISEVLPLPWVQMWAQVGPQTSLPLSPEKNLFSFPSLSPKQLLHFLYFPFPSTQNILHYCFIGLRFQKHSKCFKHLGLKWFMLYLLVVVAKLGPGFVRFK